MLLTGLKSPKVRKRMQNQSEQRKPEDPIFPSVTLKKAIEQRPSQHKRVRKVVNYEMSIPRHKLFSSYNIYSNNGDLEHTLTPQTTVCPEHVHRSAAEPKPALHPQVLQELLQPRRTERELLRAELEKAQHYTKQMNTFEYAMTNIVSPRPVRPKKHLYKQQQVDCYFAYRQ